MATSVIDDQVFAELQAGAGAEFVVELVASFLEDAPQVLAALRAAAAGGDAVAFRRHAHTLKSNGHTFGAMALAEAARGLEHAPLAELGESAPARVEALAALYDEAAVALRERCHA